MNMVMKWITKKHELDMFNDFNDYPNKWERSYKTVYSQSGFDGLVDYMTDLNMEHLYMQEKAYDRWLERKEKMNRIKNAILKLYYMMIPQDEFEGRYEK